MILPTLKKLIPAKIFTLLQKPYHFTLSLAAALYYRFPSEKMIVIGVTGTSGKTTAIELISKVLEGAGHKIGYTSTAKWKVNTKEVLNNKKMTMLGRFQTQKLLQEMVDAGCQYAIIETTSQGIEQFRALGIHYDIAVITNLYPEHIEAHGSFENYKQAKLKLFKKLANSKHKILTITTTPPTPPVRGDDDVVSPLIGGVGGVVDGKYPIRQKIKKITIANFDDENCIDFIQFNVDENYLFGIKNKADLTNSIEIRAEKIHFSSQGSSFSVQGVPFELNILGEYNIYNALIAICVGVSQGMILPKIAKALGQVKKIDGRLEQINEGQKFSVIVDYAFEPKAVSKLYETVRQFNLIQRRQHSGMSPSSSNKKIIHVLGSAGGGRDKARRPELGKLAARNADIVIVTNEDPYDENPEQIIDEILNGINNLSTRFVSSINQTVFKILDRREAIAHALNLAEQGDLVLITGKGCEQAIAVGDGKLISWDDRDVVREELAKLLK